MKVTKRKTPTGWVWVADSQRSLKKRLIWRCDTKDEAARIISEWEADKAILAEEWISLSDADKVDAIKAIRIARRGGFTLETAATAYKPPQSQSRPLGEVVREFLQSRIGYRPAYTHHLGVILGVFVKGRESTPINQVTPDDVRAFLDPDRYAAATLQGMRRRISTFFSWAVKRKLLAEDPMEMVDGIVVTHTAPKIFTVDECKRLLAAAEATDRGMIPWLALGLFCGVRPEEVRRLTWEVVKLDRGFIEISGEASKVKTRRLVTLSANAKTWLKLGGDLPPASFWKRIRKLRAAAELTHWPPDVLRHTAASMMLARDRDAASVALELGNSPEVLFRHYRELVTAEDAAAFWDLKPSS